MILQIQLIPTSQPLRSILNTNKYRTTIKSDSTIQFKPFTPPIQLPDNKEEKIIEVRKAESII